MMTIQQLCRHIIHLVHAPIGVYREDGERTAFYVDHGEQQDLFAGDPAFLRALWDKGDPACPILHIEAQRAVYGIVRGGGDTYILGPCALGGDAVTTARYLAREHSLDPRLPYRVHGATIGYFSEMVIMLFEMLTGQTVGENDLFFRSFCGREFQRSLDEKVHGVFYELHETGAVHNPYSQELRDIGEVSALARQSEIEYCRAVRSLTAVRGRSPLVAQCKELIFQRLHTKITARELADSLGIGASYLSRIFVREEGIKLTDYIIREKIEEAKKQHQYSDLGYGLIAHSLGFSTQSHFGQAFKKWVGMTPGEYRTRYGKKS